ncbi:HNH endonuclease [Pseudoroseomonas globiformis]|uniref:HNH endonuclease n=1 Tax=Teichococcus globiformis TaxID=2307229 RepID=A0ABV7FYG0_9PROT
MYRVQAQCLCRPVLDRERHYDRLLHQTYQEGVVQSMQHQTWIFQANPKMFEIEKFLETSPTDFLWLVTSSGEAMSIGDRVFLWRAVGDGSPRDSGIVAEAAILEKPSIQPDDAASRPFWRSSPFSGDAAQSANRVRLKLRRVAGQREIIRRDWLKEDPILRDLTIMKRPAGTNFAVPSRQAERIQALWTMSGVDWTYAESVAGLWAYHRTYGGIVSQSAGSPVSETALLTGRAVSGVYNKVMNFRSLDPRDSRSGFSGGSKIDQAVWFRFYDAAEQAVRSAELENEFRRLWEPVTPTSVLGSDTASAEQHEQQVSSLAALPLKVLMARYERTRGVANPLPKSSVTSGRRFERDPLLSAIAKVRASFRCEVVGCVHPTFVSKDGQPYVEVHHIMPLSQGGPDVLNNLACVCPAHHREVHVGRASERITNGLLALRASADGL